MDHTSPAPSAPFDVIVIGAGIGGLTAAALLSRAGTRVLVLEMDARPGGYLAGFRRLDYRFDSAIHWLNQLGPQGLVTRIFDLIGPDHPVALPQRAIRRYKGDSYDYLLTDDPEQLKARLIADFPHERQGIERFFRAAKRIGRSFERLSTFSRSPETLAWWERPVHTLKKLRFAAPFLPFLGYNGPGRVEKGLARFFKDPRLHQVFASEMDLLACLVPIGWAYHRDYQRPPVGGSQVFPEWLVHVVEAMGGEVRYKARVEQVLVEQGAATGVRYTQRGKQHEVRARKIIAACDVEALYERMLPAGMVPEKMLTKLREAALYPSSVTVSLALDRPVESFGLGEELIFLSRDDVSRMEQCGNDPAKVAISILPPSLRDPSLAPPGGGTLTLYIPAEFHEHDHWRTRPSTGGGLERGEEYEQLKQEYARILIERVEATLIPGLSRHVVYTDVATPITHWRYTGNRKGSMMGARPGKENMMAGIAHHRTPVKNLILGGHWAELGGGVPIAVKAGANSALIVLQDLKHPSARAIARFMDGRLDVEAAQRSAGFKPYAGDWVQRPTPAQAKALRVATVRPEDGQPSS